MLIPASVATSFFVESVFGRSKESEELEDCKDDGETGEVEYGPSKADDKDEERVRDLARDDEVLGIEYGR